MYECTRYGWMDGVVRGVVEPEREFEVGGDNYPGRKSDEQVKNSLSLWADVGE